jgi:hypothetical protein
MGEGQEPEVPALAHTSLSPLFPGSTGILPVLHRLEACAPELWGWGRGRGEGSTTPGPLPCKTF